MRMAYFGLGMLIALCSTHWTHAQDAPPPLRTVIDQALTPPAGLAIPACSDAEFLRRVTLDLVGYPPSASEARAFLAETATDKREKLVDQLLASPGFDRQLASTIDLWLMERRANANIPQDDWHAWLLRSIRERKPWNLVAREILTADGSDPATRPAARFFLDRGSEPNQIARDIGRVFFGRDLQCAQCHDHPIVDDFHQADYHGLLAFSAPGYAVTLKEGDKQQVVHAEKAGSDLQFESVFFKGTLHRTPPRVPGELLIEEPSFYPGEEYATPPADNVKGVPKFSRRQKLAEQATSGSNRAFNENMANRLWSLMFGRGLIHPLDMMHPDNPPLHPTLLHTLGERLASDQFDLRKFLREIALSQTYQRPFDSPTDLLTAAQQAAPVVTQLEANRAALEPQVSATKSAYEQALTAYQDAEKGYLPVAAELDTARTQSADAKKALDAALAAVAEAQKQVASKQDIATALAQATSVAQTAAQKLPNDAELAAAVQKIAERSQQVTTEVATLQKVVEEKTAGTGAPTQAYAATRTAIDGAQAKFQPLRDTLKQRDIELNVARTTMQDQVSTLVALDSQLAALKKLASLSTIQQTLDTARQALATRTTEHQGAQEQLAAYAVTVTEHEAKLTTATQVTTASTTKLQAAQAEQTQHLELVQTLTTAADASTLALAKLPNDADIVDASAKLKGRLASLQTETAGFQVKVNEATTEQAQATANQESAQKEMNDVIAERTRREQLIATLAEQIAATQAECTRCQTESSNLSQELVETWAQQFALSGLKPLTPEQLCWSIYQVTGVSQRYRSAEVAELDKTAPLTDAQKQDPTALSAREVDIEQRTYDKLKGNVGTFVQYYGAGVGQPQGEFFATAEQALFAANGGSIMSWVAPTTGNVTESIINQPDAKLAAEELYLTVLTRLPTEEESNAVAQLLASRTSDKPAAAQELVWGLLNSAEFRFNH